MGKYGSIIYMNTILYYAAYEETERESAIMSGEVRV